MTYIEKLKDPRWQRRRLEIMNRDQFTCQMCACKERELQVHHKAYTRGKDPWDYPDNELVTLCDECHKAVSWLKENIGWELATKDGFEYFTNAFRAFMLADDKQRIDLKWTLRQCAEEPNAIESLFA